MGERYNKREISKIKARIGDMDKMERRFEGPVYDDNEEVCGVFVPFRRQDSGEVALLWVQGLFPKPWAETLLNILDEGMSRIEDEMWEVLGPPFREF